VRRQPRHRPPHATALLLLALLDPGPMSARAGGYTPAQARDRMTVPEGFRVEVFASEPDIRQPVAACFDERGRLWVIEYLQYPNPAGLKPVTVDQYLRTEYDRVPEPPPKGPRGADRIKILEDTDGDGRADKVTTFVEGLNLASAIAVGHGGVFVGQAPYLLFYPDRNKDDKPDGDPEVLLSGFGLQDAHATVNSLAWGPDGWLYGAQGSTVTARIRGVEFQQGIWRYHPRTRRFELFAEGGGNTWGLDFDRRGDAFGSSNGGFVAFHMVQGGYYWKGFAKHGPLHNPRTYGYFNSIEYHGPKPGGHVTPGGIIYKGDTFPSPLRGAFIGGNLLANTVYWYTLEPKGSSFTMRLGGTLIDAHDPWFRPIDLLTGPDGSVFVVDWYDKRASHLDPRDNWDRTNGRIYKVIYRGTKPVAPFDLSRRSSAELVALRSEANDWWPDMARRLLAERRDASVVPGLKSSLLAERDEALALRDLWALDVSGGLDDATAMALLDHPAAGVRRWTVRLLGDDGRMDDAFHARLVELARREPDATVRSQLASSCQRWPADKVAGLLRALASRDEDADDPHIPLLLWWAVERPLRDDPGFALEFASAPLAKRPIVSRHLLERIARAVASRGDSAGLLACEDLLKQGGGGAEGFRRILVGLEQGFEGRPPGSFPPSLRRALEESGLADPNDLAAIRLGIRFGSESAYRSAVGRVAEAKAPQAERVALVEMLGKVQRPEGRAALLELIRRAGAQALQMAALNALAQYQGSDVADALLERYRDWPEPLRERARDILCSRKEWAARLLDATESGEINAKDLKTAQALKVVQHGDAALSARLEKLWGRLPGPGSPEKVKRIAEVRGMLPEGDKGNAVRGRDVFAKTCAGCHRLFGDGANIGPDLTGAERGNLDFLLQSLVDPSAVVRKEYQAQAVATKDGRVLNGLVVEENDRAITLFDAQQQRTVLPRAEIEEMRPSAVSLMPEGVLDTLAEDQVRDLFKYLQSPGPPPR
jgi:putative membrane-bound dehydrogenase-like protein